VTFVGTWARAKELLVEKIGRLGCRHQHTTLVVRREGLQVRCTDCGCVTELFVIAGTPERQQ
jgi:hypothetical protein